MFSSNFKLKVEGKEQFLKFTKKYKLLKLKSLDIPLVI